MFHAITHQEKNVDFSIAADQLGKALRQCYEVAKSGKINPVLGNILIKASGKDSVTFTAFDGRLAVVVEVSALVHKQGSGLLPHTSVEFITSLQGTIILQREATGFSRSILVRTAAQEPPPEEATKGKRKKKASTGSSIMAKFHEVGSVDDYPKLPERLEEKLMGQLNVGFLVELFKRVEHAISRGDGRPNLEAVELSQRGDGFRMVATDGHRLAMLERKLGDFKLEKPIGISLDAAVRLRALLENEAPDSTAWRFGASEKLLCAERTGLRIITLLMEEKFPEYERVIPTGTTLISTPRIRFAEALTRVSLVLKGKEHTNVGVNFAADGTVALEASSPLIGEATDKLETGKAGVEHTAKFNHRHLLEALEAAGGEEVQVGFSADNPALLKSQDGFVAVVMPRR